MCVIFIKAFNISLFVCFFITNSLSNTQIWRKECDGGQQV